jgi:protein tyrosine/serine phosphatase
MMTSNRALSWAGVVGAAALLSACGAVPGKASPNDPAGNYYQVSEGIYRSGRPDQPGIQVLADTHFKTIIDLENDDQAIANERSWATAAGLTFISTPMSGTATPDATQVSDILARIANPANHPVLVHCQLGQDRTGVIIALYRVLYEGWQPKDAHDEMLAHHFNTLLIALNHFFEQQTHWED